MTDEDTPHIYGAPDPQNRQPPGEEGLRGEGYPKEPAAPGQVRTLRANGGIEVEEQSGTAFAETTASAEDPPAD